MISQRLLHLKPSPTLKMAARAKDLAAKGYDVVSLTVGEPDWSTFTVAAEAGKKAIDEGKTKYTAAAGIPELRSAIAKHYSELIGLPFSPQEVFVGTGAKFVLFTALQSLVNPGDEVLIPAPYWVSYPAMVELSDGRPVIIPTEAKEGFRLTPRSLEKSLTPKTKVIMLCSPSNPTGLAYSKSEILQLAAVLRQHPNVMIISDDIYNRLIFSDDKMAPHLLQVAPDLRERVIAVNGAAKTYAMTGWRVGWSLAPAKLTSAMADFASQTTSNVSTISQYAALAAIEKGEPELKIARENLRQRMQLFLAELASVPQIEVMTPDGAFYFWVSIKSWLNRTHSPSGQQMMNSGDVSEVLLSHHHLATVPGMEFGMDGYLRLSFATHEKALRESAKRLRDFAAALSVSAI
jgi:aspartate aminotransferase